MRRFDMGVHEVLQMSCERLDGTPSISENSGGCVPDKRLLASVQSQSLFIVLKQSVGCGSLVKESVKNRDLPSRTRVHHAANR